MTLADHTRFPGVLVKPDSDTLPRIPLDHRRERLHKRDYDLTPRQHPFRYVRGPFERYWEALYPVKGRDVQTVVAVPQNRPTAVVDDEEGQNLSAKYSSLRFFIQVR